MKIYYPDEYNLISVVKGSEKLPLLRFIFNEETMAIFEEELGISYEDPNLNLVFTVTEIQRYENQMNNAVLQGTEESIIITLVNDLNPEQKFSIDLFIQDFVAAFVLSRALKTPLFTIISENDISALQETKTLMSDLKIIVKIPERRTAEYKKLIKAVTSITLNDSHNTSSENYTINVNNQIIDQARGKLLTLIYQLYTGSSSAVLEVYQYIDRYNKLYKKLGKTASQEKVDALTEDEKVLLYLKNIVFSLENDTHPISLAGVSTNNEDRAIQYIDDALSFEKIMSNVTLKEVKHLEEKHEENKSTTKDVETASTFLNTDVHSTPEPLARLLNEVNIDYLWTYDWNNPLEDEIKISELKNPGDFMGSLLLVIASRLLKLKKVHSDLHLELGIHPISILISSLTSVGETFRWAAKQTVKAVFNGETELAETFIAITTTKSNPISGALGMMLHGIGHLILEENITESKAKIILKNHPNMISYINEIHRLKNIVPEQLSAIIGEAGCFIISMVLPSMIESGKVPNQNYITEALDAMKILGEMVIMGRTSAAIGSEEWNLEADKLTNEFIR
jgi:hypothetical protein